MINISGTQLSQDIKQGMEAAAEQGIHVGRPPGSIETPRAFLLKYPDVIDYLNRGLPVRTTARRTGVSRNTVRKVRDTLELIGLSLEEREALIAVGWLLDG